jgi:hypothetical protein
MYQGYSITASALTLAVAYDILTSLLMIAIFLTVATRVGPQFSFSRGIRCLI